MGDNLGNSNNIKEENAENGSNNIDLVVNEEPDSSSSNQQQTWTDSNNEDQKTQANIKEKQEKINHLKELQELENSLQSELVKSRNERHKLQSEPIDLTRLVRGELTEENMKSLEMIRRGIDNLSESENDKKEFNQNIQTKSYLLLDKIRINSVNLANYHNHRYHVYKNILFTIFRVPLILLAGLNSFFSVGLQGYMAQEKISLITAVVSLFCGILTSIELLLNLQKRMEMEQESAKAYYKLAVDIYTELAKAMKDRGVKGDLRDFLKNKFNDYQTLFSAGNTVNMSERNFIDEFELYISSKNADDDDYKIETGSLNGLDDDRDDISVDSDEMPSDRRKQNQKRRISHDESSSICPVCCSNLMSSCLSTMFFCCTGAEARSERIAKKQRLKSHAERKQKVMISRNDKYSNLSFDFV